MRSDKPVTHGQVRVYVVIAVAVAFLMGNLLSISATLRAVDSNRHTCERGNTRNVSELRQRQNLIQNAKARTLTRNPAIAAEAKDALERARRRKAELIGAAGAVATAEGAVTVDCVAANPKPWPFDVIE